MTGFGPTTFTITLPNATIKLCIQLTATSTSGEFTMAVALKDSAADCTSVTLNDVATVTLDANNNITGFTPDSNKKWGGHDWASMTGSFATDGTGSGSIDTLTNPTATNGSWAAGGVGLPGPKHHEHKHGHNG